MTAAPSDDATPGSPQLLHLRRDGCSALFDLREDRVAVPLHWGADLGPLSPDQAAALADATLSSPASNEPDLPVRIGIVPEPWTGWQGRPGLAGSRRGRDWSPKFILTAVDTDQENPGECTAASLTAVDETAGLELRCELELLTGGVLRLRAELTNRGDDGYQVDDLVLAMPVPERARELLDFGGRWGKERIPQRTELTQGTHLREGRKGRTGADAATLLHLGERGFGFGAGELWAVHTGWSGNHTHYAERNLTGHQVLGGGERLLPGEVILDHGDSYATPWLYFVHGVGLDDVARRLHRQVRSRPGHVDAARPVTFNAWEAVYFDHDVARLGELAELAAQVGVERFVLDDGWFGSRRNSGSGLGDWVVSEEVWPHGLDPLIDKVTGLGMQFGLWVEPEMVNPDSDLARAHPEWVLAARPDRWPVPSRRQQVLNLGEPGAYAHVRDQLLALLARYDIAYLKWDHNRDLVEAGDQLREGRPGVHAQTLAAYWLMAELKAAHPGLEIESCSSGGARVDLGVLQHTDRVWVSDCIDPLERLQLNRWTTQLIPPELMGSHIASGRSHSTGRRHDLSFRAATAVFGHLGIEWDLTAATPQELAELADWVGFHKEHRGLLLGGDLVRSDSADAAVWVHGVVAPDRSRAIFSISTPLTSDAHRLGRICFAGLDPDRDYHLRQLAVGTPPRRTAAAPAWLAEGVLLPGRVLMAAGVEAPSLQPEQAQLLELQAR